MQRESIAQAIADLDAWLQTMRQPGGYGGPVTHWWQHRMQYTGPGLDWRYEGILIGYATLYEKTGQTVWLDRLEAAVTDLVEGQRPDGSFRASRFELNPGTLGTPHEAAAALGLLFAAPILSEPPTAVSVATRNLRRLIDALWDGTGFNDRPDSRERVPNKLATLAHALMLAAERTGDESYLPYARACLDDVLRFQEAGGELAGAVHQYAPGCETGDDRFFPYYAARCVPPLAKAAQVFGNDRYAAAASAVLGFLAGTMAEDGSWPQVVYRDGRRAAWPRWYAGVADILLAFHTMAKPPPAAALERLLNSQLASGAFRTATGFASRATQRPPSGVDDVRDALTVVGWNDKTLRLLADLHEGMLPAANVRSATIETTVGTRSATLVDAQDHLAIDHAATGLYHWAKTEPWARVADTTLVTR